MRSLTEYSDFRLFLSDWIADRKEKKLPASNRWFAQRMGIDSTSWLTAIVKGARRLTDENAVRLAAALGLLGVERRYFCALVAFTQAKTAEARNRHRSEMGTLLSNPKVRIVGADQSEYYCKWYHSVIRSLIGMQGYSGNAEALCCAVVPHISPAEAKDSVTLLERIGLVCRRDNGEYTTTDVALRAPDNQRSLMIEQFQREMLERASEAIDRFPQSERLISTLTLGVSSATIVRIRDILDMARREIVALAVTDENADRTVQLNMQLFGVSEVIDGGRK